MIPTYLKEMANPGISIIDCAVMIAFKPQLTLGRLTARWTD